MKTRRLIDKFLEYALAFIMSLLVIDVLWQVASRYVIASPSSYTDEIAGYLLIWTGLLGAALVMGKGEHLAIDILLCNIKGNWQRGLNIAINIAVALFALAVMTVGGTWLVYTRFLLSVTSASLELNLGYVYMVLPVSGILIIYYSLDNIFRLKGKVERD